MNWIERLYRLELIAGALLSGAAILGGVVVLTGLIHPAADARAPVLTVAAITLVFVAASLALRLVWGRAIPLPLPKGPQRVAAVATTLVFLWVMAYGVVRWPQAPVRASEAGFVDKAGRQYTEEEFVSFKRWETAFVLFWLPFALVAITALPAKESHGRSSGPTTG